MQAVELRCYRKLLKISYKDRVSSVQEKSFYKGFVVRESKQEVTKIVPFCLYVCMCTYKQIHKSLKERRKTKRNDQIARAFIVFITALYNLLGFCQKFFQKS